MKLLKKILLPVNPEYYTHDSFEFTIQLAKLYQSEIIPVHVIAREAEFNSVRDIAYNIAEEHIKKVQSRIKKEGLKTGDPVFEYGNHFDRIVITALRHDVNVIIFGIRKSVDQESSKLDLIIEKVIRHSDKPVWVVKEGQKRKISNILCPVDFSEASKRAIMNAIHLSQKFDAKLTMFSVYTPFRIRFPWLPGDFTKENEESYYEYNNHFKSYLKDFTFSGNVPAIILRTGVPDQEILKECKDKKYDLLIMGSSGRTALGRIMTGSVTEKVIRQAPCSFLTTKSEDFMNIQLETKINNIEHHYNIARQHQKSGLLDEAIGEYLVCLSFNDMHIASLLGMSEAYGRKGMKDKEVLYKNMAIEIINRLSKDNIRAQ